MQNCTSVTLQSVIRKGQRKQVSLKFIFESWYWSGWRHFRWQTVPRFCCCYRESSRFRCYAIISQLWSIHHVTCGVQKSTQRIATLQEEDRVTAQKIWWSLAVRFLRYVSEQTDRQTDRQTDKHTHHNTGGHSIRKNTEPLLKIRIGRTREFHTHFLHNFWSTLFRKKANPLNTPTGSKLGTSFYLFCCCLSACLFFLILCSFNDCYRIFDE